MDLDRDTDLNSRSYGIFIQSLATPRYISDGLFEVVSPWSASFLEYNCVSGSVLCYRAAAFGDMSPSPRGLRFISIE